MNGSNISFSALWPMCHESNMSKTRSKGLQCWFDVTYIVIIREDWCFTVLVGQCLHNSTPQVWSLATYYDGIGCNVSGKGSGRFRSMTKLSCFSSILNILAFALDLSRAVQVGEWCCVRHVPAFWIFIYNHTGKSSECSDLEGFEENPLQGSIVRTTTNPL